MKRPFHGFADEGASGKSFWKDEWGGAEIGIEAKSGGGTTRAG